MPLERVKKRQLRPRPSAIVSSHQRAEELPSSSVRLNRHSGNPTCSTQRTIDLLSTSRRPGKIRCKIAQGIHEKERLGKSALDTQLEIRKMIEEVVYQSDKTGTPLPDLTFQETVSPSINNQCGWKMQTFYGNINDLEDQTTTTSVDTFAECNKTMDQDQDNEAKKTISKIQDRPAQIEIDRHITDLKQESHSLIQDMEQILVQKLRSQIALLREYGGVSQTKMQIAKMKVSQVRETLKTYYDEIVAKEMRLQTMLTETEERLGQEANKLLDSERQKIMSNLQRVLRELGLSEPA